MIAVQYRSLWETIASPMATDWDALRAHLSEHAETTRKEDRALWSPVSLVKGARKRANASVAAVHALVIDIDGDAELEQVATHFRDREWIAYSTWSHRPDAPRFHFVARLDQPVEAAEWSATHRRMLGAIGAGDKLSAPSHAYFLPQHRPGAKFWMEVNG